MSTADPANAALIAGVAGGTSHDNTAVVIAGLAGLAAGAFSMAAGEYASVASQSEAAEYEIDKERVELLRNPHGESAELVQMYIEKGLEPDLAREVVHQIHRDTDNALAVHAREELGVDPESLASPVTAATSSFVSFAFGALIPIAPFLVGWNSLVGALVLTLIALFACGAVVTRVTSRSWWYGGLRQALLGGVAFAATYLVGLGVGTQV